MYAQMGAQLTVIFCMLPYFIINRALYSNINKKIISSIPIVILSISGVFMILALVDHCMLVCKNIMPILVTISSVILAPVMEEMYFRGILQDFLYNITKENTYIVTAALFALSHIRYWARPCTLFIVWVLGMVNGRIRQKYNNLLPSMIAHSTYNWLCNYIFLVPMP